MLDLAFIAFMGIILLLGMKRPFLWVLGYIYVDILGPQRISWGLLSVIPISLIFFVAAFAGWLLFDRKDGSRFTARQAAMLLFLLLCGMTTLGAEFPESAVEKWSWVWKSLVFAIFLPFTIRTRLRIEATLLVMVLTVGAIIISAGIKTLVSGGGYGELSSFTSANHGIYEGSTLSTVAITIIPLIVWLARHGTIFKPEWRVTLYALGLGFAALLVPVGTQTRTGLLCIGVLAVLSLRDVKRRFVYLGLMAAAAVIAIPFLPQSYTERMSTIRSHEADTSASTRIAVWQQTLEQVKANPMGGGFDAYLGNEIKYKTREVIDEGGSKRVERRDVVDEGRAYHSAYFEVLGEQGWLGLTLWLSIQLSGLLSMERIRWKLRRSLDTVDRADASLAVALQIAHLVYMFGAIFVGIAYQPFIFMLVALEIGLALQVKSRAKPAQPPQAARESRAPRAMIVPGSQAAAQ